MPGLLDGRGIDRSRVGVFLGAGTADLLRNEEFYRTWITKGLDRTRPLGRLESLSQHAGRRHRRTRSASKAPAAASSPPARRARLRSAGAPKPFDSGRADAALAGGTDALSRLTFSGFNLLRLMDPAPCRPFDRSRAGMNIGEGAGILVLERLDRARARGAPIYAELAGHASRARRFIRRRPSRKAGRSRRSSRWRLQDAGINADEVDHVNAHGTATPQNDAAEARGFRRVFGDRAARIPVTSIKSMIGHCLGAAGAVEAAALALTVARGAIPPTIHHSETDDECALDVVANEAREQRVRCGVSTSLGFGGNDAAVS